jgi:hypothetical protein
MATTNADDYKRAQDQLHRLEDLIDNLQKIGADVPESLTKTLKALRISIDTGMDLGNAAAEASSALAEYTTKVNAACGNDFVCLAREEHVWQARNTNYTLNWDNPNSAARNFVRATLQRYLPQRICEHLDLCKPLKK